VVQNFVVQTLHLHRPRPKHPRPPLVQTAKVTAPYRAEHRRKKAVGMWRPNIEEAMGDAKALGSGAVVVSSERVLLARFENATRKYDEPVGDDLGDDLEDGPGTDSSHDEDEPTTVTRRVSKKLTRSRRQY